MTRVFVALGTQKFPFDRLVHAADSLADSAEFDVYIQYGTSEVPLEHARGCALMPKDDFTDYLRACDVFITHGGVGSIRSALAVGKRVVAVPRLEQYGEHIDDHQIEIVRALAKRGWIYPCEDVEELPTVVQFALDCSLPKVKFPENHIPEAIELLLASWINGEE